MGIGLWLDGDLWGLGGVDCSAYAPKTGKNCQSVSNMGEYRIKYVYNGVFYGIFSLFYGLFYLFILLFWLI